MCETKQFLSNSVLSFSIRRLKTADSVLLSLFMRDNGRRNIPHVTQPWVERYTEIKKVANPTIPKDQKLYSLDHLVEILNPVIQTSYSVLLSLFMRDNGRRNISLG